MKRLEKTIKNYISFGRNEEYILACIKNGCSLIQSLRIKRFKKGELPSASNTCGPAVPFAYAILDDLEEIFKEGKEVKEEK